MANFKALAITIVIFCTVTLAVVAPVIIGFGKTGKNTQILGKDYSLLTKSQIINKLNTDFPLPATLALTQDSRTFTLNLASISAAVNQNQTANNLLFRRLNSGVLKYFSAFFSPKNFNLEVNYNGTALDNFIADLSTQINRPFVPSELSLDSKTKSITIKPGVLGQTLNQSLLREQINSALQNYSFSSPLTVPVAVAGNLPDESALNTAKQRAEHLVGKSLALTGAQQEIVVDDQTLISWLGFPSGCQQDDLNNYVSGLLNTVKKDPVDATLKVENGQVLEFRPSENGYTLDPDNLAASLCEKVDVLANSSDRKAELALKLLPISSKINTADVNNLGIKELLGRGVSTFHHSTAIRNMNVERGASVVNRLLVPPGETFSFLKALGDVSVENGYKMAYVIRQGKTELDVGGGICQVSTTFFRAMLNAGVDIIQRQNHAYRVQYYEEDMPPGYDATVFIPAPDLKFVNDTGHYLLIQSQYDGKNKKLTYEIYGTSDGRQVEISNYHQWGWAPAPPSVYIDDPTLPAGKVVQDEHAIPGLKTAFDWKVTRNGEVIHQKTFQSVYTPWAAVYRRGTQTN